MEKILYDKTGEAAAYIAGDFYGTIYLWEGLPVAYLYEEQHVYGFNGRHLGWFRNEVLYNDAGERIGFTYSTCPASIAKPPVRGKRIPLDEMKPRWTAPSPPKFGFNVAGGNLGDFLRQGRAVRYQKESPAEDSPLPPAPPPS